MFAAIYSRAIEDAPALLAGGQEFSPRVEAQLGGRLVLIDIAGLGRIVGDAPAVAKELRESVARGTSRTSHVAIAVAPSRTAALLLAVAGRDGLVRPGRTAAAVGALNLSVFDELANQSNRSNLSNRPCALCVLCGARRLCGHPGGACTELPTLRRWGLSTLGDLAALPSADLAARLGQVGVVLQRLARGIDTQPLVPVVEEARFEASLDLEWPIDDLQPLSFVLTRLLDPLSAALERADRGAAAIVTELTLVSLRADSMADGRRVRDVHVRRLELPAPMRDTRVLRTLILLDLESHPPQAGIDRVAIRIEPTPGRIVQFSLLERAGPQPETIATLVSRLTALMGEGRVGSPAVVDSHAPDSFGLTPFLSEARDQIRSQRERLLPARGAGGESREAGPPSASERGWGPASIGECWQMSEAGGQNPLASVLRRFRLPVAARVVMAGDRPVRVTTDRIGIRGGDVQQCAGPWRSSGGWWSACGPRERAGAGSPRALNNADSASWDRDEYDVALGDGAAYRIYRDRHEDRWFVEGILD